MTGSNFAVFAVCFEFSIRVTADSCSPPVVTFLRPIRDWSFFLSFFARHENVLSLLLLTSFCWFCILNCDCIPFRNTATNHWSFWSPPKKTYFLLSFFSGMYFLNIVIFFVQEDDWTVIGFEASAKEMFRLVRQNYETIKQVKQCCRSDNWDMIVLIS